MEKLSEIMKPAVKDMLTPAQRVEVEDLDEMLARAWQLKCIITESEDELKVLKQELQNKLAMKRLTTWGNNATGIFVEVKQINRNVPVDWRTLYAEVEGEDCAQKAEAGRERKTETRVELRGPKGGAR